MGRGAPIGAEGALLWRRRRVLGASDPSRCGASHLPVLATAVGGWQMGATPAPPRCGRSYVTARGPAPHGARPLDCGAPARSARGPFPPVCRRWRSGGDRAGQDGGAGSKIFFVAPASGQPLAVARNGLSSPVRDGGWRSSQHGTKRAGARRCVAFSPFLFVILSSFASSPWGNLVGGVSGTPHG